MLIWSRKGRAAAGALAVTVAIVLAYRGFHGGGPAADRAYRDYVAPIVARS